MEDIRFSGTLDHIAVKTADMEKDIQEYERIGFTVETKYEDWAMVRDPKGFGIALLPAGSKHPEHFGLRVETMEELENAAAKEGRPIKPHRDGTSSFYTKGAGGKVLEVVFYPPDFGKN